MRVRVTSDCKVSINGYPHDLKENQTIKGSTAAYLLSTGAPVEQLDEEPPPEDTPPPHTESVPTEGPVEQTDQGPPLEDPPPDEPPEDVEPVPTGNIETVLAWVGEQAERAVRAIEAEKAGKARTTLIQALEKIASPETSGDGSPDTPPAADAGDGEPS